MKATMAVYIILALLVGVLIGLSLSNTKLKKECDKREIYSDLFTKTLEAYLLLDLGYVKESKQLLHEVKQNHQVLMDNKNNPSQAINMLDHNEKGMSFGNINHFINAEDFKRGNHTALNVKFKN